MSVSVGQALGLYIAYLQQRIQGTPPALVNNPSIVTVNPSNGQWVSLSLTQMLSEAQRGTPVGVNEAVKYASAQGYQVVG
jgi:hypothetical protein